MGGLANLGEVLINVETSDQRKMLIGLGQQARGQVQGFLASPVADDEPPAQRHSLTHSGTDAKRGKPVVLQPWKVNRKVSRWDCG